jgi:hypothetical protein
MALPLNAGRVSGDAVFRRSRFGHIDKAQNTLRTSLMNTMTGMKFGRAAAAVLALVPVGACAKTSGDNASSSNATASSTQSDPRHSSGMTLEDFQKRQRDRLMAADTDGDGRVSKAEFLAAVKTGKGNPAKRFAKMDQNGDGMLDKSEIDAMLARRFKRIDADGNGIITTQERAAARAGKHKAALDSSDS